MPFRKNTPTKKIIDDVISSKDDRFKGDSKKKRIERAIAISYKVHGEEKEVATFGSYLQLEAEITGQRKYSTSDWNARTAIRDPEMTADDHKDAINRIQTSIKSYEDPNSFASKVDKDKLMLPKLHAALAHHKSKLSAS